MTPPRAKSLTRIGWLQGLSIPSDWTESKVKYVAPGMQAGEAITAESIEPAGTYPVYGGNGLRGYTEQKTHYGTRILIGRQGALCGNVHLVSGEYWASEHAIVVRPGGTVDARWLAHLLRVMNLGQYSQTAAQPGIGTAQINALSVPVPPAQEQRAIADYLDRETARIDTLIEEQQQLIELLRERRWSVVERSVSLLDWNTPLKAVAVLIQTGPFGSQLKSDEYEDGGTPVINPSHIVAGQIVPDPRVAVGAGKAAQLARHALEEGDLVAARRGELGRCAVVGASAVGYLCGTGSALIRFNQAFIEPAFGAILFSSRRNRDALALASVGSTMDNLNSDIIGSLRIPVPTLTEQRGLVAEISGATAKIDRLIEESERFIELAKERRSAVITAAVTGQIDVREGA
ncbi:restriction endonuclease subunit S [Streptomyces sp. SS10]